MGAPEQMKSASFSPADMSAAMLGVLLQSGQLLLRLMEQQPPPSVDFGLRGRETVLGAFYRLGEKMLADPFYAMRYEDQPWQEYFSLWQSTMLKMLGQTAKPVIQPRKSDKRFIHAHWEKYFLFDYIKQSYLITARYLLGIVATVEGLDDETRRKVEFYTRQVIDAFAPSNFILTNPQVLDETLRTGGTNLINGLKNLLSDLERGGGRELNISMTDTDAFRLGENIAVTKGKVIYQNDLMQLLQYAPTTQKAYARPLLIIPPWINKYYILDLSAGNSFIRWAVEQGHTVFVISWVNPDAALADKDFENYLREGPLAAIEAIRKATGESTVNAIGYCLGGTLLATFLAYLAEKGKSSRVASATFLTTLLDFEDPGELGVFIDDKTLAAMEMRMKRQGYFDARDMARAFNLLRSNDLIWNFVINNYLLGKEPLAFDLLYWNSDSTHMPAKMHGFYLRNMYRRNLLRVPGGISLDGVPIDLGKVAVPSYFFSASEDHIAPWKSTYAGTGLLANAKRFVLGEAGHIAGVVNPPGVTRKYGYWAGSQLPDAPDQWLAGASYHEGSWWDDWQRWIEPYAGKKVPSRVPGEGALRPIEDTPGAYAMCRYDAPKKAARIPVKMAG